MWLGEAGAPSPAMHFQISRHSHMLFPLPGTHLPPVLLTIHLFNYGPIQKFTMERFPPEPWEGPGE